MAEEETVDAYWARKKSVQLKEPSSEKELKMESEVEPVLSYRWRREGVERMAYASAIR